MKYVKVRELYPWRLIRFARAEELWLEFIRIDSLESRTVSKLVTFRFASLCFESEKLN